jgi:hypothetical protein
LLLDALMRHSTTLRTLTFNENDGKLFARNDGWLVLSQLMLDPMSVLVELKLSDNSITNERLENLTNVLITNSKLRKLILGTNREITIDGWVAFFAILRNPNSALEELSLYNMRHINYTFTISLADRLASKHQLRKLFIAQIFVNDIFAFHLSYPTQS